MNEQGPSKVTDTKQHEKLACLNADNCTYGVVQPLRLSRPKACRGVGGQENLPTESCLVDSVIISWTLRAARPSDR